MNTISEPLIDEGIVSSIVGIMGVAITASIADTIIPKTVDYEVHRLEWLAPQPLAPGQEFDFELKLRNRGSKHHFTVVLYVDGVQTGHVYSSNVRSGETFSCAGSLTMPENTGVHYMTAKVTVGKETKTYPISTVYVARYSIEQLHWQRSIPPGFHTPPYINVGKPVGSIRPGVQYLINYRIRNNDTGSRRFRVYAYLLGTTHTSTDFTVGAGELSSNRSISFNVESVGTYPVELRVIADDVNDLRPNRLHLTDAIVTIPPTDFLISAAELDDMPFDLHSLCTYQFEVENLGTKDSSFSVDVYLDHKLNPDLNIEYVGTHSVIVPHGGSIEFSGNLITPTYYGRSYLLAKVTIDNMFEEWYVISHIDTGKREAIDGLGDLNDDGYVTYEDHDILTMYMFRYPIAEISPLSEAEFIRRADINGDGLVNLADGIHMRRYIYEGVFYK